MKKLTTSQQRELYRKYKDARLNEANHLFSLYQKGTYTGVEKSELMLQASLDIMYFVSGFDAKVIEEAKADMEKLTIY